MQLLADTIRVPESWSWLLVLLTILSTGGKPGRNLMKTEACDSQNLGKNGQKQAENGKMGICRQIEYKG